MAENKDMLARLKAVRAGNRGVITKLSKESEYILKAEDVDEGRLQTISGLLDEKLRLIKDLDAQVLNLCELDDIVPEIEEADEVISRTLDIQRHIRNKITKKPTSKNTSNTSENTSNTSENTSNTSENTSNTSENTSNTSENTSNTSENTSNTSENTSNTSENTSNTSENTSSTGENTSSTSENTSSTSENTSSTSENASNTSENMGNTSGNASTSVVEMGENSNNLTISNGVLNSNSIVGTISNETQSMQLNSPSALGQIRPKLPKLILSKFKGGVTEWTSFWDSFKVAIHENPQLSEVDKFNYLHSLLEGSAARAIQGLTLTSVNYKSAIDILQERFGKTQRIITSHMDELLKIPVCTSDRSSALRYVYDKISIHVRGLASLGVSADQYGSLLIPIIMDKLPGDMKLQIARKTTGEVWQIEELLKTIRIEVEAREASDASKLHKENLGSNNKISKPPRPTNSLVTSEGKIRCVYCNGEHYSASCETVDDSNKRKDILRKAGRCFVCLKTNHMSKNCVSPRNCRHCNNRHHQSICDRTPKSHVNQKALGGSEKENSSKDDSKNPENVTTGTTNTSTNRHTVLLQTARAVAFDENSNRSTPVRVLFDNGSQRSYVTDSLRARLGLKVDKREKLRLNTFGETRYKSQDLRASILGGKKIV